jgi:hypothetical protein
MDKLIMNELFENKDILRLIYSFGYPTHRIYMKELSEKINNVLTGNMDPIGWPKNRVHGEALCTFLYREKTYDELICLYNKYKKCQCCTRHCYYKPKLYYLDENHKLEPNPYYTYTNPPDGRFMVPTIYHHCTCKCRTHMRHVYMALVYQ